MFRLVKLGCVCGAVTHISDEEVRLMQCLCNCVNSATLQSPYI